MEALCRLAQALSSYPHVSVTGSRMMPPAGPYDAEPGPEQHHVFFQVRPSAIAWESLAAIAQVCRRATEAGHPTACGLWGEEDGQLAFHFFSHTGADPEAVAQLLEERR